MLCTFTHLWHFLSKSHYSHNSTETLSWCWVHHADRNVALDSAGTLENWCCPEGCLVKGLHKMSQWAFACSLGFTQEVASSQRGCHTPPSTGAAFARLALYQTTTTHHAQFREPGHGTVEPLLQNTGRQLHWTEQTRHKSSVKKKSRHDLSI